MPSRHAGLAWDRDGFGILATIVQLAGNPMRFSLIKSFAAAALTVLLVTSAIAQVRTVTDTEGKALRLQGSVVVIEPDIELTLVTAGGLQEPRKEWSDSARKYYPLGVADVLKGKGVVQKPDFDIPDDLAAESRMGQLLRLNQAVALSINQTTLPGSVLATKKDPKTGKLRMDWTLGPSVSELREATGADYALFTYVRDSYASGGRTALRVFAMLAGAAMGSYVDIGGGMQFGVATLVDLRTGQVVWYNLMVKGSGDLRDEKGADQTAKQMLKGLPL